MNYIDFHTHVFPDHLAKEALRKLSEHSGPYKPQTDGTVSGLQNSMQRAGIYLSVIANIATKPSQLWPIYEFCMSIKSEHLLPLVSFHPANSLTEVEELVRKARNNGIIGVKLHPMYQSFWIDDEHMYPYYKIVAEQGLLLMFHSGYDIAFPGNEQAHVMRLKKVAKQLPELRIVSTHMGGWHQWEYLYLLAEEENVYTETSMTITEIGPTAFINLLDRFPVERILFGTDSPWTDQQEMVEAIVSLPLDESIKINILRNNAVEILKEFNIAISSIK